MEFSRNSEEVCFSFLNKLLLLESEWWTNDNGICRHISPSSKVYLKEFHEVGPCLYFVNLVSRCIGCAYLDIWGYIDVTNVDVLSIGVCIGQATLYLTHQVKPILHALVSCLFLGSYAN